MKRGLSATSKSVRPSAPPGMDGGHSESPIDQWIMGAHRSRAGGPPQPKRNRVDYYASAQAKDRVVPENWEEEVLDDTSDAGGPDAPAAGDAAIEESDGAVAASQLGLPPSDDMEVGQPAAAAAPRPLRIKKKPNTSWPNGSRGRDSGHCCEQ